MLPAKKVASYVMELHNNCNFFHHWDYKYIMVACEGVKMIIIERTEES